LEKPFDTPSTMLARRVRVRPWALLDSRVSSGRVTISSSPSRVMVMDGRNVRVSSPLGPFTVTVWPSMVTSTPAGTGMGILPIRDILDTFLSYHR
jgi:hypothetical protein